jgi:hypothetical protein
MHMRLLAKHQRNPDDININVQLNKDDDGKYVWPMGLVPVYMLGQILTC